MPSHPRQLPCIGVACVLALLLSAYALAPNRAAAAHAQTAMPQVSGAVHFIQTATSPNLTLTYINNPATNNKPNAFLFVTCTGYLAHPFLQQGNTGVNEE